MQICSPRATRFEKWLGDTQPATTRMGVRADWLAFVAAGTAPPWSDSAILGVGEHPRSAGDKEPLKSR